MSMNKKLSALAAFALIPGLCWAAGMTIVDQKGLAFSTPRLLVTKGTVVSFTNSDNTSHNIIVSGNGTHLNSGLQKPGVAFNAPLMREGAYQVHCGIHPKMKMTVSVK